MAHAGLTANEQLLDAQIRHQIGLTRFAGRARRRAWEVLDASETQLRALIRTRLAGIKGLESPRAVVRMNGLLRDVRNLRRAAWSKVGKLLRTEMLDLTQVEPRIMTGILRTASPVKLNLSRADPTALRRIVSQHEFQGRRLSEHLRRVAALDIDRIQNQIRIGLAEGEGSGGISRRVVGTHATRGRTGATQTARHQLETLTRTAVTAIAAESREELAKANRRFLGLELYVAILDGRTTLICRDLDGNVYPIGEGRYPPQHFNCRSHRALFLDQDNIPRGDLRASLEPHMLEQYGKHSGIGTFGRRGDLPWGHKGRFDEFARGRMPQLIGARPGRITMDEFMRRQAGVQQDDYLGKARAKLFRRGGLTLDKFVDRAGAEIPLRDLARTDAAAFRLAGLDPQDFLR